LLNWDIKPPTVISLAKREERRIYIAGVEKPLRLSRYAYALRLLQYVRDEAHRFAQLTIISSAANLLWAKVKTDGLHHVGGARGRAESPNRGTEEVGDRKSEGGWKPTLHLRG